MSVKYADTLVDKIFEKAHLLENHPRLGRIVPELAGEDVRELIYKQYRVVYRIVNDSGLIYCLFIQVHGH